MQLKSSSRPLCPTVRFTIPALVLVLLLAACSPNGEPTPTPMLSPTPAATPTLAPGQVRVGELLDRVEGSWSGVGNVRSVFTVTRTTAGGTAAPVSEREVVVEEIKPDRRRIVVREGGAVTDEQIAVAGTAYLRGSFVASVVAPNVGTATWVMLDPGAVPPETPVGRQLSALAAPISPPFQTVSAETRALPASPVGPIQVEGRTCQAFSFTMADPTSGGEIVSTLALDAEGRLCAFEQSAGGFTNRTVFTYNLPELTIEVPVAATPVSGTPEG